MENFIILNHFTPNNWMKYIDRFFQTFVGYFILNPFFNIEDLKAIQKFTLEKGNNIWKIDLF